ncbi:uncharacterized protein LOC103575946 [Microplitis demolitor]|uniref:uncharacterized protein LOC103575946 n=1 Tax=Microplitis demolitor TaxID=69319 RepID=UPI00235B69A5|nr:uncharacterized protein LOC103575946 [Microplitis demolitor]
MAATATILNNQRPIIFDESVAHYELHAHQPYASSTLNNNDEVRITIQNQNFSILPSKSALHIIGKFTKNDGTAVAETTRLVNMGICHMIKELRLFINGVEIDRNSNVGITSLMKGYLTFSPSELSALENVGWLSNDDTQLTNADGYFDILIPLNLLSGFAEDYQKILINVQLELVLTISNTDINAYIQNPAEGAAGENDKVTLQKIEWIVPYVTLSDKERIQVLNYITGDPSIPISFRTWELYEYPLLPATPRHIWAVKTSTQLEKPRYVVLGFQSARKNDARKNASQFDHCSIRNIKLFLNSQSYPYGDLNLMIDQNQYALLYSMYTNFQSSYYDKQSEPLLAKKKFLDNAPLCVIDCSKQNEAIKSGPVDIRLEFESAVPFPPNTTAYCLVIHDRIIEYNPISSTVRKLI